MKKVLNAIWSNRPFRTFLQGFVGTFAGSYITGMDINAIKTLIISAIMAGLSAIMSLSTGEKAKDNSVG